MTALRTRFTDGLGLGHRNSRSIFSLVERGAELSPELTDNIKPFARGILHLVKLLLHLCGKPCVNDRRQVFAVEVLCEKLIYGHSQRSGTEPALIVLLDVPPRVQRPGYRRVS